MINRRRSFLPALLIVLGFMALSARLFHVQIWCHEELNNKVRRLVCKERPETPWRGMIRDSLGRVLAMSVKTYTVFIDPNSINDIDYICSELKSCGIKFDKKLVTSARNTSYVPVATDIDVTTMRKIKSLSLYGVGFTPDYHRQYPEDVMACHVLGMVGKDNKGLEGVEFFANSYLTGDKVNSVKVRDGSGREISEKMIDPGEMRGADVYLTIDRNLQFIAEQEVERAWKESKSKRAMAIIQDPNTGEILALACKPSFNPERFSGSWNTLRNPAISDIFEPGSTFKAITAAAALQEKAVKRSEVIWCEEGKFKVFKHTIKDHEKKGLLTFDEIMQYSSNIGTAKVGMRLGKEKLYEYIRQFGFNSTTGIDLPGEAKGLLKLPSKWDGLSLPIISFGQGIGITPLQLVNAYSALANGGMLLEPRIIKEIKSPSGDVLYRTDTRSVRRVVSQEVAAAVMEMLTGVVEKGTGQAAKVANYTVAGKTGTAQKRDPVTKKYSTSAYVASFCGMIPARKPRLTIMVVLDEPKGDYYASTTAAPVFEKIASRAVSYLRIAPDDERAKPICVAKKTY